MHQAIKEYGQDQLEANIEHMFMKEGAVGTQEKPNFQYNPVDYLKDIHQERINAQLREEAFLSIL